MTFSLKLSAVQKSNVYVKSIVLQLNYENWLSSLLFSSSKNKKLN